MEDKIQGKEEEALNVIPETLPKAVPGTPIPGYKNWVVGKFARVLPVVYLRRKDGKKVAKFDPSKTTHCLKRLKTEEMQESAVSELTWSLDTAVTISSGVASKSKTNSKREGDGTRSNCKIDVVQDEAKKSSEGRLEKHDNNYSSESSGWDSESGSLDGEVNGGRAGNKNLVKSSSCNLEGQIPLKVDKGNTTRSPNLSKTSPVPATQSKVLQNEGKSLSGSIELNGSKRKIHRNGVPRKPPKSTREASNGVDEKNVASSSDSSDESTDEKAKSRKIEGKPNAIELKGSNRKKQTNGVPRKLPKSTCEASNGVDEKNVASSSDSSDESTDEKAKSRKIEGKPNAIELKGSNRKKQTNGVPRKLPKSTCEASNGVDEKNVASSSDSSDESTDEKAKSRKIEGKPNAIELKGSNRKKQTNGVPRKLPKSTCEASNGVDEKNVASSSDSSDESTDEKAKSRKIEGKPNAIELKGSNRKKQTNGVPRKLPKSTCEASNGVDEKNVASSSDSSDESTDEKAKSRKIEGKPNAIELKGSNRKKQTNGVPRKLPKSTCEASNGVDEKNVASSSDSSDESTDEKAKSRKIEGKPNAIELKGSNRKKQTNGVPRKLPKSTCEASNGVDEKNVASSSESSDESTDEKAKSRKNIGKSNAIELKGSKRLGHTNGDPRKLSKGTGEFGAGADKKTVSNSRRKETESSESSDESMHGNLSEEESASSRNIGLNNGDMPGSESHSDWTKAERGISKSGDKKSARKSFSENLTVDSKESKMLSQLLGDKMKQKLSNDKRLDALMEKRKSVAAHKDIIKDALKDLDSSKRRHGGKKHIVFDDDDNEDDVKDGNRDPVRREKVSFFPISIFKTF